MPPADLYEFLILDLSGGIVNAANLAAAEVIAGAQTDRFSVLGYTRFVITIDLTSAGTATTLYLGARTSGTLNPTEAVPSDWSYYAIDDIDPATGISNTPQYQIDIPLTGVRRYTRSFRVWGSWASAIVWADTGDAEGMVYAQRFVGG